MKNNYKHYAKIGTWAIIIYYYIPDLCLQQLFLTQINCLIMLMETLYITLLEEL